MIRRLQMKFITIAMLSLSTVLAVIVITINIINYHSIISKADETLSLLEMNDGNFPIRNPDFEKPPKKPSMVPQRDFLSPELPYETRFFSVVLTNDGSALSTDTSHIAALDNASAEMLAKKVTAGGKKQGFEGIYRYKQSETKNGTRVIFLDCSRNLDTFFFFLFASILIAFFGLAAVFLLIFLLSGRIIRPISQSYEKQKRFITDAGHELKTPLTIIHADTEVLEMELGENEWLEDIYKQIRRLTSLTEHLVYLSRMDEENQALKQSTFSLSELTDKMLPSFQAPAKMQGKYFLAEVAPSLTMTGDETAIQKLLSILLDNALKYSPENTEIHVKLQEQSKYLKLTISNVAHNLSMEHLNYLFDRFYRAEGSRNSQTGGYGLGLSIARAVVQTHKGKISASLDPDSIFTITVLLPN